jgi:hypothetical protein
LKRKNKLGSLKSLIVSGNEGQKPYKGGTNLETLFVMLREELFQLRRYHKVPARIKISWGFGFKVKNVMGQKL